MYPVKLLVKEERIVKEEIRTVMVFQGETAIYMACLEVQPPSWTVAAGQNHSLRFLGKNILRFWLCPS